VISEGFFCFVSILVSWVEIQVNLLLGNEARCSRLVGIEKSVFSLMVLFNILSLALKIFFG